jgi:hypothetical protein
MNCTGLTASSNMIMHAELKVLKGITCDLLYDSVPEFYSRTQENLNTSQSRNSIMVPRVKPRNSRMQWRM